MPTDLKRIDTSIMLKISELIHDKNYSEISIHLSQKPGWLSGIKKQSSAKASTVFLLAKYFDLPLSFFFEEFKGEFPASWKQEEEKTKVKETEISYLKRLIEEKDKIIQLLEAK